MATLEKDMPNVACISIIKAWARQNRGEPNFGNMPTTLGITQHKNCIPFFNKKIYDIQLVAIEYCEGRSNVVHNFGLCQVRHYPSTLEKNVLFFMSTFCLW